MRAAHWIRGAALPETAFVLTATLGMVFGVIQIGFIGYLQIMVDGAAFIAAHEYALGNTLTTGSTSYVTYMQQVFPQTTVAAPVTNLPYATTVAVNYNTNLTTQRHGGVSLVLGNHIQATVQKTAPSGLLGVGIAGLSSIKVQGAAIEPQNWVSNDAYDADDNGYTSASKLTSYSTNVQNAPANYISAHTMVTCNLLTFTAQCPTGNTVLLALGTAEFLDHDNWQRSNLGVGPYSSNYTFAEMLYHQTVFAQMASTVFPVETSTLPSMTQASNVAYFTQIRAWDVVASSGGYPYTETVYGAFPLHPAAGAP